ncbi:hypothetical protein NNN73_11905, partial [Enterococcus faecium]|nr:hypothetical protein [Enterococcus faecium]
GIKSNCGKSDFLNFYWSLLVSIYKKIATLKSQIENLTFEGRFKIASLRITSRIASFFCLIFH